MRWDSVLDREIKDDRLKERDTACCIRKDRSGCVQSPKSECSKINDPNGEGGPPRSKWVSPTAVRWIVEFLDQSGVQKYGAVVALVWVQLHPQYFKEGDFAPTFFERNPIWNFGIGIQKFLKTNHLHPQL